MGDLTPFCGVSVDDKRKLEADAMAQIHAMLGGSVPGDQPASLLCFFVLQENQPGCQMRTLADLLRAGSEIQELWQEYEAGQTPEANLVKDFDKVCVVISGSKSQ